MLLFVEEAVTAIETFAGAMYDELFEGEVMVTCGVPEDGFTTILTGVAVPVALCASVAIAPIV